MVAAMISRVRLRGLARLGRFQGCCARGAGSAALCASCAEHLTDASGIAEALGPRPRAASPRPEANDLVAATIWGILARPATAPGERAPCWVSDVLRSCVRSP